MSPSRSDALDQKAAQAAALAVFLLIANQVAARAVRDALFLSAFEVRSLPLVMGAAAVSALAGAELLSLALLRRSPARVVPAGAALSAVLMAAWWALGLVSPRAAALLVYLHVSAFGGALVSGFWSLVNERFDPHTARRVVGPIGTGATAGGMAGGALAWAGSLLLPLAATPLLLVATGLLAAFVLRRTSAGEAELRAPAAPARLGASVLLRNPHLRNVALVVFLGAVTEALLDFQFKVQANQSFGSGAPLLSAFAAFHTAMGLLSLLLQASLSRTALRQAGIAGTLALRPLLAGLASLAGVFAPRFSAAVLARGAHEALTNSLFRSAYELLYTPVPEAEKRRVKAVIDVSVDKAGAFAGSALIALGLAFAPASAATLVFGGACLLSLAALLLSPLLHRGYVQTLEQSLLAGRVALDGLAALDHTTQVTLAHTGRLERDLLLRQIALLRGEDSSLPPEVAGGALADGVERSSVDALRQVRSGQPAAVRAVLHASPEPGPQLVAALVPLLADDAVMPDVVRALRRVAPRVTGQLVDALLDPSANPAVRRRVPRVLKACPTARAAFGLQVALDDASFDVRAAAAAALAAIHERSAVVRATREDVLARVRRELDSGETVERQIPQIYALLSLVLERGPLQIAWAAMKGEDRALRGTALEYLANVLPGDVFTRLRSCFGAGTWTTAAPRPVAELADELRTSAVGLRLEHPPWRETGETG